MTLRFLLVMDSYIRIPARSYGCGLKICRCIRRYHLFRYAVVALLVWVNRNGTLAQYLEQKTADAHGIFVPFQLADTHAGVTQDVVFPVTDTGSYIRCHPAGTSM